MARVVPGGFIGALGFVVLAAGALPQPAWAQTSRSNVDGKKWEVEIHGGYGATTDPTDGSGALPPGQGRFSVPGSSRTSHILPSWFYGDGPIILNGAIGLGGSRLQVRLGQRGRTVGARTGYYAPVDPAGR